MEDKTKQQLIEQVESLRKELAGLKQEEAGHKQAEETLQGSEERFRALVENSSDIIQVVDEEGVIRYVSPSIQRILGYKREEVIGRLSVDFVHPDDLPIVAKGFEQVLQKPNVPVITECRCKHKDGTWRVIEGTSINRLDYPSVNGFISNMHDITERKKVEEALRESEEFNSSLLSNSPNPILVLNPDTSVRYVNPALEKLTGFSSSELVGTKAPHLWWTEETLQKTSETLREGMHKGAWKVEHLFQKKDGKRFWIEGTGIPVKQSGQLIYYIVSWVDITERKRAEEELEYQRKYFHALFEGSPEAVVSLDMQSRVMDINPVFQKLFGYTLEDIEGKHLLDYILPESKREEGREMMIIAQRGEVTAAESIRKRADGTEIPVSILSSSIMLGGKQRGTFAIYRDITERKKAEEQLKHSFIDLAETVSRAVESSDPYTAGHQRRVAELAGLIGEKAGLNDDRLQGLYVGGLLHDIGKNSIPSSILSKPGKLTDEEWALIRVHAKWGYEILKDSELPWPVADMALHHHERLDGSGYPDGISGDKLSLEVRILGVCDVVEAMSSHRPYRPARSKEEVLEELKSGRGTKYDADVVDAMLEIIESGEFELK